MSAGLSGWALVSADERWSLGMSAGLSGWALISEVGHRCGYSTGVGVREASLSGGDTSLPGGNTSLASGDTSLADDYTSLPGGDASLAHGWWTPTWLVDTAKIDAVGGHRSDHRGYCAA